MTTSRGARNRAQACIVFETGSAAAQDRHRVRTVRLSRTRADRARRAPCLSRCPSRCGGNRRCRALAPAVERPLRGPQHGAAAKSFQPWRAELDRARERLLDRFPQPPARRMIEMLVVAELVDSRRVRWTACGCRSTRQRGCAQRSSVVRAQPRRRLCIFTPVTNSASALMSTPTASRPAATRLDERGAAADMGIEDEVARLSEGSNCGAREDCGEKRAGYL